MNSFVTGSLGGFVRLSTFIAVLWSHGEHKAAKIKDSICTVIIITQPMLCSNISATKHVITHVTIKSLEGISANNYAVKKSVKILTIEGGANMKLLRPFSL